MIKAQGLTKRYGPTVAVDALSFDVLPGAVTGFLGPNGSGKSTTLRMIMGLDRPDAGQARIGGRAYGDLRWPLREVGARLEARTFHPGHAFSLGMAQRLGIAAALLGDPGVLLFDEPVNGLDPEGVRWIRDLVKSLAAEGRTVLLSSHLISEMALTADHLVVIGRGRLLADTSVRELAARGHSLAVSKPVADVLSPWAGFGVMRLYAALSLGAGWRTLARRDA
ncbi:ABC transporter ATP-binding protein [Streptomyces sp. NPDC058268]|uniref:ABC transporter ATP-binding protein n=1 Tax=Streptomyces sp. NPDC058268 TaxID=3346413 RepID=UPI0036E8A988